MDWSDEVRSMHVQMVDNTPEVFRKLMELTMRPKIEAIAAARGSSVVEEADFVAGWLSVPQKGREGVINGLTHLGIDVKPYLQVHELNE